VTPALSRVTWGRRWWKREEADQAETIPAYRPVHRLRSLLPAENILFFDLDLLLPHAMERKTVECVQLPQFNVLTACYAWPNANSIMNHAYLLFFRQSPSPSSTLCTIHLYTARLAKDEIFCSGNIHVN
jgi:polyferredoxin